MKSSRNRWIRGMGAVVLVGALLVTSVVAADDDTGKNPFTHILAKLDQILAAIKSEGGHEGNHTLRWDTNHPSATRFTTAFPGAVLDKNSGLVWEQAPDATPLFWNLARLSCVNMSLGGTRGWRLPSVAELASLIDPSLPTPFVPASVFTGVQSVGYWSVTSSAAFPGSAWSVSFHNGIVNEFSQTISHPAWCVRGGMNADQY